MVNITPIPIQDISINILERILSDAKRRGECLEHKNKHHTGYTYTRIRGKKYPIHRVMAVVSAGADDTSMVVDHLCSNRSCIRPSHLEFVTSAENNRRAGSIKFLEAESKRRSSLTKCLSGHSLDNAREWVRPSGTIKRICRECHRINEANRRKRVSDG